MKAKISVTKRWPCDNCGRSHWGYWERVGAWEFPDEWEFVATTRDGERRTYRLPDGSLDVYRTGWSLCL